MYIDILKVYYLYTLLEILVQGQCQTDISPLNTVARCRTEQHPGGMATKHMQICC